MVRALARRRDVDLSAENLAPENTSGRFVSAEERALLRRLLTRRIDPRGWCHVRLALPQPNEGGLLFDRCDITPDGRRVWFLPIETTLYGVLVGGRYDWLDAIWVPSHHSRLAAIASGVPEELLRVVPLGVDRDAFKPAGDAPEGRFRFLTVGNAGIWKRKGLDVLLDAYFRAFEARDDVELVIHTRRKWDLAPINALVGRLDTHYGPRAPAVVIHEADTSDMADLYRSASCYVHPARGEAFGMAIMEAMACAVPAIVTGWGGHMDFCGPEAWTVGFQLRLAEPHNMQRGFWAEPDVNDLADAMRAVRRDPVAARRRALEGSRRLHASWTWDVAAAAAIDAAESLEVR